jgi:hypothetical protein
VLPPAGEQLLMPALPEQGEDVAEPQGSEKPETTGDYDAATQEQGAAQPLPKRFASARLQFGRFARGEGTASLAKALGHYSRKGHGGARQVALRMRVSTQVGSSFAAVAQALRTGTDAAFLRWVGSLGHAPSTKELTKYLLDQVSPVGGSLEEASCRSSLATAIAELLEEKPDTRLAALEDADIWFVLEEFLVQEACVRIRLDIGQVLERMSPRQVVQRELEMEEFIRVSVKRCVKPMRRGQAVNVKDVLATVIRKTFKVFEATI